MTDRRRERCVHPPGNGGLLRLLPDNVGRQLLEIAQYRHREREHLDLALELYLEPLQGDDVGASTMAAVATAAIQPLALARNLRRSVITVSHEGCLFKVTLRVGMR